ncbi:hypothetical protein, variant [Aphanomyces astaci]|uniref:FYVE-type domain-containing protein n=1 Tax=Aphanomyces astaci TaxID=112090 RepID=W4H5A3_APHAT|nr:hypothetical protein, variant [Aphanomyces astaci]ETV87062.1 hypothetical protein, variant [Aphanomyces astaci]|eukprot:XP_009823861.1 hypothetical protein, variant [Aphanomyces astaci]
MSSNQVHHNSYPRIEFTQDVYEKHLGNMERIATLALAGRSGWDKATATPAHGWSRLTDNAGWQVLSLQAPSPGVHEYLCFGTLRTSLVALQHAFYVKNTYEFRALSAVMYEDTIADAALLNITHRQTAADVGQFFGVKYLKLLVQVLNEEDQEQEYVYLEFSGTRVDALGRRTWFVVTEPVAIKSASDSDPSSSISSSGNSRGSHASEPFHKSISFGERCSCVKLYRETYDGCVEVTVRTKLEAGGGNPEASVKLHGSAAALARKAGQLVFWKSMGVFIPSGLAKDLLSLCRTGCVPESVRLTTGSFAPSWEHGNKCKVCFKFFNLLRRKHHCRRCGSSMCSACTVALHCVDRPTKSRTSEAVAVEKFCKSCLVQAKIDTMRVDGDAGRGGGRRRGGSDDGTTHSVVMSDSNKRVAHLHSPTRNANGDRTYSSTT